MKFCISDTFTDSLARLTGEEQKAAKMAAFDLQLNPANPGLSFHRLERVKDRNFWSVRVSSDVRLIVHRSDSSLLLCYVDHHDKAYDWAERRKMETHPKTGAAQLIEIRETVKEVVVPVYVQTELPLPDPTTAVKTSSRPLFDTVTDDELLAYGVPTEWLGDVRQATEESLLALADHLPAEAAEALLELATGGKPRIVPTTATNPFDHPDAQRRFRVMKNIEELERALDYPWEKWTVFLHPEQRQWVERDYNGPARISGSAGTGKTIVALHRAAYLARQHPDARILLTTFTDTLANALRIKLNRLVVSEPKLAERIDVYSLEAIGLRLYKANFGSPHLVSQQELSDRLADAAGSVAGHKFSQHFLHAEWDQVVDAWQIKDWETYRDVARLGRKTRLSESHRAVLWEIFSAVLSGLKQGGLITLAELFTALANARQSTKSHVFDFAIVDEAQDIGIAHLRFLATLGQHRADALFFAGDLGQRIFQQPFSWKSLGVDIRGRSRTLRVNYRTSHQIRTQSDRLLGPSLSDVDGNTEERNDTISVFNGPPPMIMRLASEDEEIRHVSAWLGSCNEAGIHPHEIGVFVRTEDQFARAQSALNQAGLTCHVLDSRLSSEHGGVSLSTMHLAKGLEFRAVVVMACDDEVIPLQERIESVGDNADLQEVYDTERHLLYVACTRARDRLLVTGVDPVSEFLDDLAIQ